jgi:hypothetical protein
MRTRLERQPRNFPTLEPRPGELYVHYDDAIAFAESEVSLSRSNLAKWMRGAQERMVEQSKRGATSISSMYDAGQIAAANGLADAIDEKIDLEKDNDDDEPAA